MKQTVANLSASLLFAVVGVLVLGRCAAFEPVFKTGVNIQANGSPIDVGTYSIPNVCDWDSDGKKDLLVGQFLDGKVRFYRNQGTDEEPVFTNFTYLEAHGEIISVPYY